MRIMKLFSLSIIVLPLIAVLSCGNSHKVQTTETINKEIIPVPVFNADSAYAYVKAQTDFGPRVPNTKAHTDCGNYLAQQLERFGAKVYIQEADMPSWDGKMLKIKNIIGAYKPESKKRLLLCAHWDSRPYADNDQDGKNYRTPIIGANDGASGVGILLEIARQIQKEQPTMGIDIIFFDAEDYGVPQFHQGNAPDDSWCLGSQLWGRRPHVANYNARYGILLDMVGGKDATFYYEGFSKERASGYMKKIWKEAIEAGFSKYFIRRDGGYVTDDHMYIYEYAHIPCVDIINYDPNDRRSSFGSTWHTLQDNMDNIDVNTLKVVGQTVMNVIYKEQ